MKNHYITYLVLTFSFLKASTFTFNYDNNELEKASNHFKLNNANNTILVDEYYFDIYRLEFILNNPDDLDLVVKNIEWKETNYLVDVFINNQMLYQSEIFTHRGCPTAYVDFFPFRINQDGYIEYIKSIEIEFEVQDIILTSYCDLKQSIVNKGSVLVNYDFIFLDGTDYIIITSNEILDIAETFREIHQDLEIDIVSVENIIDLYPSLNTEYAIREYLLDRIENNQNLNYLLLLGDESILPPIYNTISTPSDDFYTSSQQFSGNPQLSTGRIPINTINQADIIISKIENYIDNLYFPVDDVDQSWRMSISLLSDDENNPDPDKYPEISHTENSSELYEYLKPYFDISTFYGTDYIPIQSSDGLLHSAMTTDIIEMVNNGSALINYIGHGNYSTLSDEKILNLERDLTLLGTPSNKLPIWVVGTCSFGRYDDKDSMTEALLLKEDGAIAVISTVRAVGISANDVYLDSLYGQIRDYLDNNSDSRLGDIIRGSKNNNNNYLFHLFGDPALPLPFSMTSDEVVEDYPNPLVIGQEHSIKLSNSHEGDISHLVLKDSEREVIKIYDSDSSSDTLTYNIPGKNIFNGSFIDETCFMISLDASLCEECSYFYAYTQNEENSYVQNIQGLDIIEGESSFIDNIGPNINFFAIDTTELRDNDIISSDSHVLIQVVDSSGINLMGGIGHDIRYWFNEEINDQIVNSEYFTYTSSCYLGMFNILFPNTIEPGKNELYVEVWDNLNNRSIRSIILDIQESNQFMAYKVFNFPNPFRDKTTFTFKTSSVPVSYTITIFDLDGRKIKTLKDDCNNTFCTMNWNGFNENEESVENGTYIYTLKLTNEGYDYENIYKLSRVK